MGRLVVANWKMNGSFLQNHDLLTKITESIGQIEDVVICPPSVYLGQIKDLLSTKQRFKLGAQDVSAHLEGAYTGDVSINMLKEFEVKYVIVGHSERRLFQCEKSPVVVQKAMRVMNSGLIPIVCVGEMLEQRQQARTFDVLNEQLQPLVDELKNIKSSKYVVAYEPVWAIGSGLVPSEEQIKEVHMMIRKTLDEIPPFAVLYGGSVNSENIRNLVKIQGVDGFLVGGASLKATSFTSILEACV
jgi:triosephosphate isomerase